MVSIIESATVVIRDAYSELNLTELSSFVESHIHTVHRFAIKLARNCRKYLKPAFW